MNITRENLKNVKEEIINQFISKEELEEIKERLYKESEEVITNFNNVDEEGDSIDE